MNQESIINIQHILKILRLEREKILKIKDTNKAYKDYYKNLCLATQYLDMNIKISENPDKHIKLMRLCNPDEKRTI